MKKYKILLSCIVLIGLLLLTTHVQAAEFVSSILNKKGIEKLGDGSFTAGSWSYSGSSGSAPDTSIELIYLKGDDIIGSSNLFCVDKTTPLTSLTATYMYSGSQSDFYNDAMAYILSEGECSRNSLGDGIVQQAIWYYGRQSTTKPDLCYVAEAFAAYKENYVQPSIDSSGATASRSGSGYSVGPFTVTYTSEYYGSIGFGDIVGMSVVDANGAAVPFSLSTGGYPASGTPFYINIGSGVKGPLGISISFSDMEAYGHSIPLAGEYSYGPKPGEIHYCDTCTDYMNNSNIESGKWVYEVRTAYNQRCGTEVFDQVDPTLENFPSELIKSNTEYCGRNMTVYIDNYSTYTKTVKCGDYYQYTVRSDSGDTTEWRRACCSSGTVAVQYRQYIYCIGCGKKDYGYYQWWDTKNNVLVEGWTTRICGDRYGEIPEQYTVGAQGLIYGWGERYTRINTLSTSVTLTFDIPVQKIWLDGGGADGVRPLSITVKLYANGADTGKALTLSASNGWKGTFTDLDPGYTYTVDEASTPSQYEELISGNQDTGFVITNQQYVDVGVTKEWIDADNRDGVRPSSVTVSLYQGYTFISSATLSDENGWSYTFTHLPRYDSSGAKLLYYVYELSAPSGYKIQDGGITTSSVESFECLITNIRTTERTVNKSWIDADDNDGIRPGSVTLQILGNGAVAGEGVLNADNNWTYTFTGLQKYTREGTEIVYTVGEREVPAQYVAETDNSSLTVTNKRVIDIPVEKVWADGNDADGLRPSSITVKLYANGSDTGKSLTLSASNGWKATFTNLQKYTESGAEIAYTVDESAVPEQYDKEVSITRNPDNAAQNQYNAVIKNTQYVDIGVIKEWVDASDRDRVRPSSIVVTLNQKIGSGEYTAIASHTLSGTGNEWSYTFNNLTKYTEDGTRIYYKITEDSEPNGYMIEPAEPQQYKSETKVEEWLITNIRITERTVDKTWVDKNDFDGVRPESITIQLYGDGSQVREGILNAGNNWTYTFTRLPKYTREETEIVYTIDERVVPEKYLKDVDNDSLAVTNTRYINIDVNKKWIDGSNEYNKRPSSIIVAVFDENNTEVARHEMTGTGNDWSYTFENLPKYRPDGTEITYTVKEKAIDWYETKITKTKDPNKTVITQYTVEIKNRILIDIPVEKTWVDNSNPDRPIEVTVVLSVEPKEDATLDADKTAKLTKDNDWKYTFEKLPKYTWDGELKTYTLTENNVPYYKPTITGSGLTGFKVRNDLVVDLSLRKFITKVNDTSVNRMPQVDTSSLETGTTATYNHTKEPLSVRLNDLITYTIRVYNESETGAFATEIKDYIPSNLEFLPNNETNQAYGWSLNGSTLTTTYLQDTKIDGYLGTGSLAYADIQLVSKVKDTGLSKLDEKLVNIAEITGYAVDDFNGGKKAYKVDRDSKPLNFPDSLKNNDYAGNGSDGNYVKGQEDDDDFDVVITDDERDFLDLALRKFITRIDAVNIETGVLENITPITADDKSIVGVDRTPQVDLSTLRYKDNPYAGKTATYNHIKNAVDVAAGDLVTFTIRVYNEGFEIDAYAREIVDYIPTGFKYVPDNEINKKYGWTQNGNTLTTTYLKDTKLAKYNGTLSYADVELVLQVNTTTYNELIVNIAEVSKYGCLRKGNIKEVDSDRDSWPENFPDGLKNNNYEGNGSDGNYVKGQEDDDDFDRVRLTLTHFSGVVWKDGPEGKGSTINNILTDNDERFPGIKVILHRYQDNTTKDTTTNSSGTYYFQRECINHFFYISFEYQGQEFRPVDVVNLNDPNYAANKSAGSEKTEDRDALNAKFYEIVNGTARNSSGDNTVPLTYTKSNHQSILNRNVDTFVNATKIQAHTVQFRGDASYTKYINLGLALRDQVNLGVAALVDNAVVSINGKSYTYEFPYADEGNKTTISYKQEHMTEEYNHGILETDYNFKIEDYNDDQTIKVTDESKELDIVVTYKILIQNYSSKESSVSNLKMYFDPVITYIDSWYETDGTTGNVTWTGASITEGFNTRETDSLKDIIINPDQRVYVYARFRVQKDDNRNIKLGDKFLVTEIAAYTTPEGLIDKASEPDNISVKGLLNGNWSKYIDTWENDTHHAVFDLVVNTIKRTMTGYAFMDTATMTDADGVNIGDGYRQNNENLLDNITVQLIEKVDIAGNIYEYIWQETNTGSPTVKYMDKHGKLSEQEMTIDGITTGYYGFKEFIPGDYIIRFKYGNKIVDREVYLNGQDYKTTTYTGDTNANNGSYAKDNKDRRLEVMNESIEQDYKKQLILSNNKNNGDVYDDKSNAEYLAGWTWMYADTYTCGIGVDTESPGHNINFGLIERPKSRLELDKNIVSVKVTNKGIILVDTENDIGVVKNPKNIFLELDDELMNGATMTVKYSLKVTNTGENDTLYNYFEGDPKYGTVEEQRKLITSAALTIYDYAKGLSINKDKNPYWTKEGIDLSIVSSATRANLNTSKDISIIVPKEDKLYKQLAPNESTETVTMELEKILTIGGNDNFIYYNSAEIVKGMNAVGRKDMTSTFGNYLPVPQGGSQLPNPTEPDSDATSTILTEATGITTFKPDYTEYIIWIVALSTLVVGGILVEVMVLRKKK